MEIFYSTEFSTFTAEILILMTDLHVLSMETTTVLLQSIHHPPVVVEAHLLICGEEADAAGEGSTSQTR